MSYIEHGSFKFGSIDMYDTYGIQILDSSMAKDLLLPAVRPRKVTVPLRHGQYDYGAKYYDERSLVLNCVTILNYSDTEARSFAREIAYALSKKNRIRIWNEPNRYYIGRVEKEIELEQTRDVGNVFNIEFTCEPFAYGDTVSKNFENQTLTPNYIGTAQTPTIIEITNTGSTNISGITIKQVIRKDSY